MSLMLGLRIFAVVMLGLAAAHSARVVLWSIAGHERLERRDLIGEALHGLGALGLGLGLLPGNSAPLGDALIIGGALLWVAGAMVQPLRRATPRT
jgi:drug/metabolite transporter (DMT)-like permease